MPSRERICRSLKRYGKDAASRRLLWKSVLEKVYGNESRITSTTMSNVWHDLVNSKLIAVVNGLAGELDAEDEDADDPASGDPSWWDISTDAARMRFASSNSGVSAASSSAMNNFQHLPADQSPGSHFTKSNVYRPTHALRTSSWPAHLPAPLPPYIAQSHFSSVGVNPNAVAAPPQSTRNRISSVAPNTHAEMVGVVDALRRLARQGIYLEATSNSNGVPDQWRFIEDHNHQLNVSETPAQPPNFTQPPIFVQKRQREEAEKQQRSSNSSLMDLTPSQYLLPPTEESQAYASSSSNQDEVDYEQMTFRSIENQDTAYDAPMRTLADPAGPTPNVKTTSGNMNVGFLLN